MSVDEGARPQARRPTIRDVAAEAGVSKSVASRVYSGSLHVSAQSRRRVEEAAERIGFRPNWVARSLAGERDDFVGILVADLHNPVFAEVVDAARAELSTRGQVGLLTSAVLPGVDEGPRLDDHALALFGDLRPSRILVVGTVPDLARVAESASNARLVVASAAASGVPVDGVVRGDERAGMRLLLDHLAELGHSDIAHVAGGDGPVAALRAEAYREVMADRGLERSVRVENGQYTQEGGYRAAVSLLSRADPPTALVAANDLSAIGVLVAVAEHERETGRRVAVTGYDNTFLADLPQIALTSIDPGNARIGREAARLVLAGDVQETELLIAPTLFARASTAFRRPGSA